MSLSRLAITAELVATMRRDGVVLVLTRYKGAPGLLPWFGLSAFITGAVLLSAGVHSVGPVLGTRYSVLGTRYSVLGAVTIGCPFVCFRNVRRTVDRAVRPDDVGGAVASAASPSRSVLRDPDTGYEAQFRTRKVRCRGSTAAVEITVNRKRRLILVPNTLLTRDDVMLLTHRV